MTTRRTLGFDRRVNIEWLDAVAGQVAQGADLDSVRAYLDAMLEGIVSGNGPRSAREKTVTVLCRVWANVPTHLMSFRDRAVQLLGSVPAEERVAVHWGMMIVAYPFFCDVAQTVGRLIALQGDAHLSAVERRVFEMWGQRSTAYTAVRRVVRSMVQWGALRRLEQLGVCGPPARRLRLTAAAAEHLVESLLIANDAQPLVIGQVAASPLFFPFCPDDIVEALRRPTALRIERHGSDTELVTLC